MPAPSPLGVSIKETLDAVPGVTEHPSGHSENLLRYVSPGGGGSFAVGRTEITSLRFWVLDHEGFRDGATIAGHPVEASIPKPRGNSGRNSNLDQIPEFKRKPLLWARVTKPSDALTLLGVLVAALSPGPAEPGIETVAEVIPAPLPEAPLPEGPVVHEPATEAYEAAVEPVPTAAEPEPATPEPAAPAPPIEPPPPAPEPARVPPAPIPVIASTPATPTPRRGSLIGRLIGGILGRGRRRP